MSEWKKIRLGEICSRVTSGGTPASNKAEYYGGNIPWLRTQEVNANCIEDTEIKITEEGLANSAAKWIPKNAVIVAMYGNSAGRVATTAIPLTTNQACCNLIVDSELADYKFVYYSLLKDYSVLHDLSRGAAQKNLNAQQIKDYIISLPPRPIQDRIAGILSDYDSAIVNCRKQIALLEEAAMRLYREWFKDGKGEKKRIGDFVECTIAGSWGTGEVSPKCPNKVICIRGADFEDIGQRGLGKKIIRYVSDKHMAERSLNEGDMIIEMSGGSPTQATGRNVLMTGQLIQRFGLPVLCTNFCKLIRPQKGYSSYLYLAWKDLYASKVMFNYEVGTTGIKNFDYELFAHDVFITDPGKKIDAFNQVVSPMFDMIDACGTTIANCAEARDRLLPKLMKGEIAV